MKKYLIKEINNYYNDVYFDTLKDDIENYDNTNIFLLENRDNGGINDDLIHVLINQLYNYSDYDIQVYYKNSYVNYIIDTLKPYKKLSLKRAIKIMLLLKDKDIKKDVFITSALSIIFNGSYEITCLKGYNQSDWIHCFYNKDVIDNERLQYIEAVLFNTGLEIFISCDKVDIDNIDIDNIDYDIDGYYEYIVNYYFLKDKKHKACDIAGIKESDAVYFEIKDIKTVTREIVTYKEGV